MLIWLADCSVLDNSVWLVYYEMVSSKAAKSINTQDLLFIKKLREYTYDLDMWLQGIDTKTQTSGQKRTWSLNGNYNPTAVRNAPLNGAVIKMVT